MKNSANGKNVTAHLFEYTTSFVLDPNLHFKFPDKGIVPTQMIFCLKEKNQWKINSQQWFFNAFAPMLQVSLVSFHKKQTKSVDSICSPHHFVSPPSHPYGTADTQPPAFLGSMYVIQVILDMAPSREPSTNIPADVLCGIQLHTIVPSCTPVDDDSIPLILHLRSQSEDADTHDWLQVLGFEADVMQVEKFQYMCPFVSRVFSVSCAVLQHVAVTVSPSYAVHYLVPLAKEQPPEKQHQYPEGVHLTAVVPPPNSFTHKLQASRLFPWIKFLFYI